MACRDCYFWRPKHEHSKKAPCLWPGVSFIPPSVVEIEKVPMRGEDGRDEDERIHRESLRIIQELRDTRAQRDAAIARAERAERVAVWAVVNGVAYRESGSLQYESWENGTVSIPLRDDTDADLYRALVEACEGW